MGHSECGDSNSKFTGVLGPMKSVPAYTVKFHVCPCVKLPMAPCGISLSLRKVSRDTCGISLSFLSLRNLPVSGVLSWIFCPCGTRSFVYIYSPSQGFFIIFNMESPRLYQETDDRIEFGNFTEDTCDYCDHVPCIKRTIVYAYEISVFYCWNCYTRHIVDEFETNIEDVDYCSDCNE